MQIILNIYMSFISRSKVARGQYEFDPEASNMMELVSKLKLLCLTVIYIAIESIIRVKSIKIALSLNDIQGGCIQKFNLQIIYSLKFIFSDAYIYI